VEEVISGEVEIVGDMEIALEAAFGGGPGIVIIAGTGSIAYGRDAQARSARAGGWGFAVSDEGSGYWIGRAAVGAALRAEDRGESPFLFEEIARAWGLADRERVVLAANATPAPDFAGLLPVAIAAADAGDPLAQGILTNAGEELSGLVATVAQRLFPKAVTIPVAMTGGVFANSALVRQAFYNYLLAACPNVTLNQEVIEPVQGALALARKSARR
jgi:N-acetylglucosamine kinase-like BadF-type ATPase